MSERPLERHLILREIYKRYLEIESLCKQTGRFNYEWKSREFPETVQFSFFDLQGSLKKLSKRKKEAVFYNVCLDWKQKDVAAVMGIKTVTVGQYVEAAMLQVAKEYWEEEYREVVVPDDDEIEANAA